MTQRKGRGSHARDQRQHFAYQLWGCGRCLYVGQTCGLPRRLAVHGKQWWRDEFVRVECRAYANRSCALTAEADLIAELQPDHNTQHADVGLRDQMRAGVA